MGVVSAFGVVTSVVVSNVRSGERLISRSAEESGMRRSVGSSGELSSGGVRRSAGCLARSIRIVSVAASLGYVDPSERGAGPRRIGFGLGLDEHPTRRKARRSGSFTAAFGMLKIYSLAQQ
jgi:hypothetical protein